MLIVWDSFDTEATYEVGNTSKYANKHIIIGLSTGCYPGLNWWCYTPFSQSMQIIHLGLAVF